MMDSVGNLDVEAIRDASRRLVRELGFMRSSLAGSGLPPSAVHTLLEIGARGSVTALALSDILNLEKSSISRMLRKLIQSGDLVETQSDHDGRVKPLSLTRKGRETLGAIDGFAKRQVAAALAQLAPEAHDAVLAGLAAYAGALEASRAGGGPCGTIEVAIESGCPPGVIGRIVEIHGLHYARAVGFGHVFESGVAAGLAGFAGRLDDPRNRLWTARRSGIVAGSIAIDGEDLGPGKAHLRWFIVEQSARDQGIGRRLLAEALRFCDRSGFAETHLWTFRSLDAARRLYEQHGFSLVSEMPGRQWGTEVMEQRFVRPAGVASEPRKISGAT